MFIQDIKTENDARESLMDKIIEIKGIIDGMPPINGNTSDLECQDIFYKDIKGYAKGRFGLDTTPYDNIMRKMGRKVY